MAAGQTLASILPQNHEPPVANFGTIDTINAVSPHFLVDLAIGESFIGTFLLPRHYDGGDIKTHLTIAMTSATSDNVRLTTEIEKIGSGKDLTTDAWAAASNTGNVAVPNPDIETFILNTAHTDGAQMDNAIVGDFVRVRVTRIAVTAGSDAAGDVEIRGIEIQETPV